ncbi:MAG: Bug family tripartite tricarboxylate transporter substrate binding protein [Burkholderiales bacterium]
MTRLFAHGLMGFLAMLTHAHVIAQQVWPAKPVRVVVSNSPGGAPDIAARIFNDALSRNIGRPVLLENRPGADSYLGAEAVARAEPDGHTLFLGTQSVFALHPHIKKKMPLDPVRDFTPIAVIWDDTGAQGVFTAPSSPFRTWQELVAFGKANPGKLDYATSVPLFRMLGIWISKRAGFEWQEIPYKIGTQAQQDVATGRVAAIITAFGPLEPLLRADKLRVLVATNPVQGWPKLPQLAEIYPGYTQPSFVVLAGPAGIPPPLAQRINRAAAAIVEDPKFNKDLSSVRWFNWEGARSPEGTAQFIRVQREAWGRFIKEAGIEPE